MAEGRPTEELASNSTYLWAAWMAVIPLVRFGLNGAVAKSVYAEDGAVFFSDALHGVGAFFSSYSGYGHFLPRLVALIGALLPVAWYAWVVVVGCSLVTFGAGVILARAAERLEITRLAKLFFVLTPVLLPAFGLQVILNLANLQWIAVYVVGALVLAPADGWPERIAMAVSVATGLAALFVVPLLALRRDRVSLRLAGAALVGLGYHVVCAAVGSTSIVNPYPRHAKFWGGLPRAAFNTMAVANSEIGTIAKQVVFLSVCLIAFVVLAVRLLPKLADKATVVGMILASLVMMLVTTAMTGEPASRYAYGAVALAFGAGWTVFRGRSDHAAALALATALGFAWLTGPWLLPWRADQPSWLDSVDRGRAQCASTGDANVGIEVFPRNGWPPARVPCRRLR